MFQSVFNIKNLYDSRKLLVVSLVISPLFLLTISGWMTRIIAVCALLAIYVLWKNKEYYYKVDREVKFNLKLLTFAFTLPLVSVLLGQLFNWSFMGSSFDSPAHIFIAVFVLFAMLRTNTRLVEWMSYILPVALLLALINVLVAPDLKWDVERVRVTTQALDPLAFGSLCLTFAILSLFSILLHSNKSKLLLVYKVTGFFLGVYLSIASGSRTGWLALPIVGFFWIFYVYRYIAWWRKIVFSLSFVALVSSSYFWAATVQMRVDKAVGEITAYEWSSENAQPNQFTSVGARLSFPRIAAFLVEKNPLGGWGEDGSYKKLLDDPALNFADQEAKRMVLFAGFHNEITAKAVQSGIWGLISSIAMFLIPAVFFIRNMSSKHKQQSDVAFLGLTFLLCQFVSSMTMELTNLRYAASFFGLMIAIFCGQILFYAHQASITHSGGK